MYSLKQELKLNNKERSLLDGCASLARLVYNLRLSILTQSWQFEEIKASDSQQLADIQKVFTNQVKIKPEYAWIKGYPLAIYPSALNNLGKAIQGWRLGKSGLTRFKFKKKGDSFTSKNKSGVYPAKGEAMMPFTNRQVRLKRKQSTIPGLEKFRLKQPIAFVSYSKTFTISRAADKGLVSWNLPVDDKNLHRVHQVQTVGVDLGVKCFATLSDGLFTIAPQILKISKIKSIKNRWYNRNQKSGNRTQTIRASNNGWKYYQKLPIKPADIANLRRILGQKKITTDIISRKYYQIRIEDLNISGTIANQKLAIDLESLGIDEFRRILTYKVAFWGTKVELVDRWSPSSKTCSCCGNIQQMPLKEPVYSCDRCGVSLNCNLNAAIILENARQSIVPEASAQLRPANNKMPSSLVEAGSKRQFKPNA
ncbi:MAG: transposase [Microcoleus sp. PH2017_29_MFU_D_A]|uniref:RNA-guided endonuclease InsQ/TnpB family protein n=1 Tax=unclassified Microcoleus TaxID=2642155 RepID=UPI001D693F72|nr:MULTISPECIES: transposase [unclassified Microcoleus]MCC3420359.1 transposase [Microcoleus sp. PH2017_07_MST_O_A]MCC3430485.1 transposase [Microcoleus sp. PH2017_04_SCI_O_A]MCC3443912.1 transposase [Microcoleus sp. PH2017_03_ELD_O_A]MCC3468302.1 transposase [Microcoleus sp. PH2017_06_SFM_O_A]MCC3502509.1 transposase [Microcoleus sp. PH2017_19_SFW_U_A]MCC3512377.1 transposase [Microcoleus sp. PH2017_17_BER_D_A]TAE14528.1 MAG: transposase [Oscillatoriales cyanobacterium]